MADRRPGVMTPRPSVLAVPNQEATKRRTIRVSDELWEAAQRVAADRGETVTQAVRDFLERYVRQHPSGD